MPMQRYSSELNSPSVDEGDSSFVGVNEWDSAENIPPGQVQAAVNMDFTTQDAVTRGGFVCLPSLATEAAGFVWTIRTSAANLSWTSVTYGNGLFVAVASAPSATPIMTSPDGITWTSRAAPAAHSWQSVAYGNSVFVAVTNNGAWPDAAMYSSNGINWSLGTTPSASYAWRTVTFGNGIFVAVSADQGAVMTSTDGVTWTLRSAASTGAWNSVTFGNGIFVAVSQGGTAPGQVMTSPDGITWTSRTSSINNNWYSVIYGAGLFVAVAVSGTGNRVMTSPDGITWTTRATPADNSWSAIAYGNNIFVATAYTGSGNRAMSSPDGVSWTIRTSAADNNWLGVAFGGGLFVAVSNTGTGNRVMTSGDSVWGSAIFSDPSDAGSQWIMTASRSQVSFNAFGRTSRTVSYASGLTVSEQSTIVQCNNLVYIFRGSDAVPLYWTGNWGDNFELAPTPTPSAGFSIIPNSNQATYYQNRLWVVNGKDEIAASDVLDFTAYDDIANSFNLNTGDSNFLVTTYPFGDSALLVFKNRSIILLQNVDGSLTDVTATEVTRQVGAIGINAVVSVGPDVVYMSDRNINLITLTSTNNSLQHKTLPLSKNIQKIFNQVNWNYAYKVSMGFYDNKLFVALPLDNSTTCNAVVVYNFVTENWFGEWNFDSSLGIAIQNFVVATYLGLQRLHAVTEDGRIFVVGEGPQDISGTTVAEITASLTTRAYSMGNQNHIPRRMYLDLSTWRPSFSVTAYSSGVNEYTEEVSDQTYSRSTSWIFNDSTYSLTNSGDNYNRQGRKDYAGYCSDSIQAQSGFLPEAEQEIRFPILTRRKGRLSWLKVDNTQGLIRVMTAGFEARGGDRNSYVQAI